MNMDLFGTSDDLQKKVTEVFTANAGYQIEFIGDKQQRANEFFKIMGFVPKELIVRLVENTHFCWCGYRSEDYLEYWDWTGDTQITEADVIELAKILKPEVVVASELHTYNVVVNMLSTDMKLSKDEVYEQVTKTKMLLDNTSDLYHLEDIMAIPRGDDISPLVMYVILEETEFSKFGDKPYTICLPKTDVVVSNINKRLLSYKKRGYKVLSDIFKITEFTRAN